MPPRIVIADSAPSSPLVAQVLTRRESVHVVSRYGKSFLALTLLGLAMAGGGSRVFSPPAVPKSRGSAAEQAEKIARAKAKRTRKAERRRLENS